MQDEREMLVKLTLPRLKKIASERDVTLTFLDLRWGITEEESQSGKVLEICFREIENSVPFFVGIIGDRYGWVPDKSQINNDVLNQFNVIQDYLDKGISVTEMEMRFGVLEREEELYANFYIKENSSEHADEQTKLNAFKKAINDSGHPISTYSSLEDLASKFEQAFIDLLDRLFPNKGISEAEKERIGHQALMNQLCQFYIKDDHYFDILDEWLDEKDSSHMVVTGPIGVGKSSLLANWTKGKIEDSNMEYNMIYFFPTSTSSGSSHTHIMNYLISCICDLYEWDSNYSLYDSPKEILEELFMRIASSECKPLLIILDSINQIEDVDDAKLLNWLPDSHKRIKMLFSTRDNDRSMENFTNRHYRILRMNTLSVDQRKELIAGYLSLFGKKLTEKQINSITLDKQCENTLTLKTLLDELIHFGDYEHLSEKIDSFMSKSNPEDFYHALLQNYESHFGRGFVEKILLLLYISRDGLSEDEILVLSDCKPIHWSQFHCSLISHLTNKQGYISFTNTYFHNTVKDRYSCDARSVESAQNKIIEFFQNQDTPRAWEELAYQYMVKGDINLLWMLLKRPQVMSYYIQNYPLKAWKYLQEIISDDIQYDLLVYLDYLTGDFQMLVKYATYIYKFTEREDIALAYMQKARECMKEDDKAYFFHAMGLIYKDKANEFFRKELSCLASQGLADTEIFADAIICVTKTNDYIGQAEYIDIESEEQLIAIKESIREEEIAAEKKEEADAAKTLTNLGPQIYEDFKCTPEYHFEFEEDLCGDELQIAYITEALSIVKKLDVDKQFKRASYNSYIGEIFSIFLSEEHLPMLEEALEYFTFYKTRKCPEVAHILYHISSLLTDMLFWNDMKDVQANGKCVRIDDVDSLYQELIDISRYLYGDYSIFGAEVLYKYSGLLAAIGDFSKKLLCYEQMYEIYDKLGMIDERDETKEFMDKHIRPRVQ